MKAVSVDIMSLLNTNGLGVTGTDLFAMAWNESVDSQILILDTPGVDSPLKEVYEQPTFQILVRGEKGGDMITAHDLLRSIHEFLIVQPTQTIDGTDYLQYEPLSTIAGLGRDDNDRPVFTMNYYTFRNPI